MSLPARVPRGLYPFESHRFDLDGLAYHYVDEGSGDPVVMVHGNPTWSFYFRDLILALRGDRPVEPYPSATLIPQGGVHVAFRRAAPPKA